MHASYTQPRFAGKTTPIGTKARRRGRHKLGGLTLLLGAMLVLVPIFAYADVPVATISGPVSIAEGDSGSNSNAVMVPEAKLSWSTTP